MLWKMKARIYGPGCQWILASLVKKSSHDPKKPFKAALCILWVVPVVQNSCRAGFGPVELWVCFFYFIIGSYERHKYWQRLPQCMPTYCWYFPSEWPYVIAFYPCIPYRNHNIYWLFIGSRLHIKVPGQLHLSFNSAQKDPAVIN